MNVYPALFEGRRGAEKGGTIVFQSTIHITHSKRSKLLQIALCYQTAKARTLCVYFGKICTIIQSVATLHTVRSCNHKSIACPRSCSVVFIVVFHNEDTHVSPLRISQKG